MTGEPESTSANTEPAGTSHSLRRNIGYVAAASAVALVFGEVVTLGQTVALARLLSPAEVGVFVAGTVLTSFLGNFVEGGLRSGLVHRNDKLPDAAETVFWVTIVSGLLMTVAALAAAPVIGLVFNNSEVGYVAAASSGVLLVYALTNVPEALLQRKFSVRRRLIVGPSVAVAYATVSVSLAALGWGVWSMVVGLYVSQIVWVATLWLIADWRPGRGRASLRLWRELARYGLPLVIGMLAARVYALLESVVVGRGLSEAALGNYRYGQRIAMIPQKAIIEIGAVALFPAFSRISKDLVRLKPAYLRAIHWATIGAAALSGLMVALGVPAAVVVLGEPWRGAGVVVMAMAGLGIGKALISVSEEAIKGGGRTALLNWYSATEVILGVGLLLVLIGPLGLLGAGLSVSITSIVVGVTCVGLARPVVRFSIREVSAAVLPQLPCAAVATAACAALEHLVLHSDAQAIGLAILFLTIDVVVFCLVYLACLALVMPSTVRELLRMSLALVRRGWRLRRTRKEDKSEPRRPATP
ncbi:oligosaccharide flippase family protein [Nakamurella sp. GG22]